MTVFKEIFNKIESVISTANSAVLIDSGVYVAILFFIAMLAFSVIPILAFFKEKLWFVAEQIRDDYEIESREINKELEKNYEKLGNHSLYKYKNLRRIRKLEDRKDKISNKIDFYEKYIISKVTNTSKNSKKNDTFKRIVCYYYSPRVLRSFLVNLLFLIVLITLDSYEKQLGFFFLMSVGFFIIQSKDFVVMLGSLSAVKPFVNIATRQFSNYDDKDRNKFGNKHPNYIRVEDRF